MRSIRRILRPIFWLLIAVLAISFFLRDLLPPKEMINSKLRREPIQEETTKQPFTVKVGDIVYTVTPQYNYDLVGLVVSEHQTNALFDYYHRLWDDVLNVKDVCVVWGDNALSGVYREMKIKSGSFTCYFRTNDWATWQAFDPNGLSNNHLLTASPEAQKVLNTVRRGDQIQIKGYLASYSHSGWFERGTSVTRTDTGKQACETIYITEIQVLKEANPGWRLLFTFSLYGIIIIVIMRTILFFVFINDRVLKAKQTIEEGSRSGD